MNSRQTTHCRSAIAITLLTLSMSEVAHAVTVYSPLVQKGEVEIEYQVDVNRDGDPAVNNSSKHQIEIAYGVTEEWKSAINAVYLDPATSGFAYDRLKWENIYQLFEHGERWLDAGLYFEYQIPDAKKNAPDVAEIKILLQKSLGSQGYIPSMKHTFNVTVKKGTWRTGDAGNGAELCMAEQMEVYRGIPSRLRGLRQYGTCRQPQFAQTAVASTRACALRRGGTPIRISTGVPLRPYPGKC